MLAGRVTIGAISRLRSSRYWSSSQVSMPRTRPIPTTQSTVVAWKQPLGRAPGSAIHTARPIRCEGRLFFFFSVRFFSIRDTGFSPPPHSFNNHSAAGQAPPRSLTTTRTQQSLLPATAPCEQSILDFPDHTCRILLPEARFCSRATKSQTPDVSS